MFGRPNSVNKRKEFTMKQYKMIYNCLVDTRTERYDKKEVIKQNLDFGIILNYLHNGYSIYESDNYKKDIIIAKSVKVGYSEIVDFKIFRKE